MASSAFEHNFGSRQKQINFHWLFPRLSIFSFSSHRSLRLPAKAMCWYWLKRCSFSFFLFYHRFLPLIFVLRGNRTAHWWSLRVGGESLTGYIALRPFRGNFPPRPGAWYEAIILNSGVPASPNNVSPTCYLCPCSFLPAGTFCRFEGILGGVGGSARCLGVNQEHSQ